jgi:hypothetical protein
MKKLSVLAVLAAVCCLQAQVDSGRISGTVLENPGVLAVVPFKGIVGARLVLWQQSYGLPVAPILNGGIAYPDLVIIAPSWYVVDSTVSGLNGAYAFNRHPVGYYRIVATKDNYLPAKTEFSMTGDTTVTILMTPGAQPVTVSGNVKGMVCSGGNPCQAKALAGCSVMVSIPIYYALAAQPQAAPIDPVLPIRAWNYLAATDANGNYAITMDAADFDAGNQVWATISTQKSGYVSKMADTTLYLATTTSGIDFVVDPVFANSNSKTMVADSLLVTIETEKTLYAKNEWLYSRYTIANSSYHPITIQAGACDFDLKLTNKNGAAVYQESSGRVCNALMVYKTLAPYESFTSYYQPYQITGNYDTLIAAGWSLEYGTKSSVAVGFKITATSVIGTPAADVSSSRTICLLPNGIVRFELPVAGRVTMEAIAPSGRTRILANNRFMTAGTHDIAADIQEFSDGIALIRIRTDHGTIVRNLITAR